MMVMLCYIHKALCCRRTVWKVWKTAAVTLNFAGNCSTAFLEVLVEIKLDAPLVVKPQDAKKRIHVNSAIYVNIQARGRIDVE